MAGLPWIGAAEVSGLLPVAEAVDVLERALLDGLDPGADPARTPVATPAGQLLLMPSEGSGAAGVKIASVAPDNPSRGLPRIQAVYVLFDGPTLRPVAVLDGTALTSLRTPAMSAVAVRRLATPGSVRLVVFGTGPQAWAHVQAVSVVRPVAEVAVIARAPARTAAFAGRVLHELGLPCRVGTPADVAGADVVVCATTSSEPLFAGELVHDGACVVAVGSHEPHRRELDGRLVSRATVVVEDAAAALREAGDVIMAVGEGVLDAATLVGIADLVTGRAAPAAGRPSVYKSVGMAWQDLVVAAEIHRRHAL